MLMRWLQSGGTALAATGLLLLVTVPCLAAGRLKTPFPVRHEGAVGAVVFAPDGRAIASGGEDQLVLISDLATGKELHRLRGHEGRVSALAYSPDGKTLASGSRDSTICLWDAASGKLLHRCPGHERTVLALAFAPDGRHVASASYDGSIRLWQVATGKSVCQADAHADAVSCVAFAPDGKTLASGGYDRVVRVWTVAAGRTALKPLHHLRPGPPEVTGVAFCLEGRYLAASTSAGEVRLWDTLKGDVVSINRAQVGAVLTLACSADGRTLAVAGMSGRVELFEAATGQVVGYLAPGTGTFGPAAFPLGSFDREIRAAAVSAGGLTVAAGTKDGRLLVWDVAALLGAGAPPGKPEAKELEKWWQRCATSMCAAATVPPPCWQPGRRQRCRC